jgi:hypothetical protein
VTIVERARATLFISLALVPATAYAQPDEPDQAPSAVTELAPRPVLLTTLYGSFIGLQALDVDSTMRAVRSGAGQEANPALRQIGSPALFAMKAGATASIILACERLRKERHPLAAVVLMIGANSAYAMITAHNYAVLRHPH